MKEKPLLLRWEEVGAEHPMTKLMQATFDSHRKICAKARLSPWDFCVMLANVQGMILAKEKEPSIQHMLQRADNLRDVVTKLIYESRAAPGSKMPS